MRFLKLFAVGIGVLVGLVVVAVVIIALTFDPNDYKEYAQTWVEDRTGRSLNIDGDIELSVFPWLAVETGHVELGNAPGFGTEPFVSAQRVSARVRLMPLLLRREFEIGTVNLDGLELDLSVAQDGTTNWSDLIAAGTTEASAEQVTDPPPASGVSGALTGLDIEGVELRGSRVVWRENGAPRYIVSDLSLSTGAVAPATPVAIDLEMDLLDVATQRTAHVAVETTASVGQSGSLSALGSAIDFRIGDASGTTDAEGNIEIETLEFVPGIRVVTGPVRLTNTANLPVGNRGRLASELAWNALAVDLLQTNVTIDDLEAAANGVRAQLQLVGEDLAGESALLRGSIVIDDSAAAAAIELAGLALPADIDAGELGNFSGSATFMLALDTQNIELSNVDLTMLGIDLRAQQAALRGDTFSAQLDVTPFRPNATLRRLIAPFVPEGVNLEPIGSVALDARVAGTMDDLTITGLRLAALGAELTGQLRVQQSGAGTNITGDITSNRFAPTEIFAVAGALVPESVSAETAGTVSLSGQFAWNTAGRSATVRGLRLEAFGLRGTGEVAASGIGVAAEVTGNVQVENFDPRDLLERFSLAVPQTSDDTALRRASVSSRFDVSQTSAAFDDLTVNVDDSRMTGTFVVSNFEDPLYRFTLATDRIDIDRYLPPQTPPGADAAADDGERRAGDIALSNEALSAVNIDANVSVGGLRLAGMDFSNVRTSMVVGEGRMSLDSAHAELYGGTFDGSFRVDASGDLPGMSLRGTASRLALAPLITALADSASFSGTGSFDIDLTGRGPTVTDNLRSAAGTMGFELLNGSIDGFNVDKTLCRAFNSVRGNPAPRDMPDRSDYEFIRGTATVTNGIAASNDLVANVGSAQVRGSGTLALADQIADYDFDARLVRAVPIQGCAEMERIVGQDFPLELKGPLTSPEISPDYNEVIRRVLEYRLREEVRDRILDRILR
jgi:AsmA protein